MPDPEQRAAYDEHDAGEDEQAAAQRCHPAIEQPCDDEGRTEGVEIEDGEDEPPPDGVGDGIAAAENPAAREEGEDQRREQNRELRAEQLVVNQAPARERRGKEESDLRLAEGEAGALRWHEPAERDQAQEDKRAKRGVHRQEIGWQAGDAGRARRAGGMMSAGVAEEHEVKIRDADDRAGQVLRLAQPPQARAQEIVERPQPQVKEGAEHGLNFRCRRWRG